jgi:hypothetical protein
MKSVKYMNRRELKVCKSVYNGWFMSGKYSVKVGNHERYFEADSPGILFKEIDRWFVRHERNHMDSHMLVKCVQVL